MAFGSIRVGRIDSTITVNVQNAPAGARLDAWIDFNGDGSWGSPGEHIFASTALNDGDNVLRFDVPSWASPGNAYARFRLSSVGGLGVGGLAADGEVEDYLLTIDPPFRASGQFFERDPIGTAFDGTVMVLAVDLDGDGDVDVLSQSFFDSKIAWFENDGSGGFTSHSIDSVGLFIIDVFAVDVDGDGDVDVLSASLTN